MRTVVIVPLDPARDALLGLVEVLVFVEPHLLFFQAAMKPFDVAAALGPYIPCPVLLGCTTLAHFSFKITTLTFEETYSTVPEVRSVLYCDSIFYITKLRMV